jgi:predicted RNA binding protein YcfA (HicA-like mRNA interferase family)
MSQQDKLLSRLRDQPRDFTWGELKRLLNGFGYVETKGSGSRRKFVHRETKVTISLHEPHPAKVLKAYQIRDVLMHLKQEKYL